MICMKTRFVWAAAAAQVLLLFVLTACQKSSSDLSRQNADEETPHNAQPRKHFAVRIDWVPSPEYYGFFYAREKGIYAAAGLDVDISYGSGAPAVAKELAVGSIYAGTTTSDNLLREVAGGARCSSATPLLRFNPCVIASLAQSPITTLEGLRGKTIGTNQQSSVYQQFIYVCRKHNLDIKDIKEYPIGYGGAAQLKAHQVDAILAYTTNVVVDLEKEGIEAKEVFLSDNGVVSYGLVLIIADETRLQKESLTLDLARSFARATLAGYERGARDVQGSIAALKSAEPTLDDKKLELAIRKISVLNGKSQFKPVELDRWLEEPKIDETARAKAQALYQ
jgi:ABC-type nitrate/sulfonate/bicarbonate transport system substrate-binding protein